MKFLEKLQTLEKEGKFPSEIARVVAEFYQSYEDAIVANGGDASLQDPWLCEYLDIVVKQCEEPHSFDSYHERITEPFDFYHFGLNFLRPVVLLEKSTIAGDEKVVEIEEHLARGDNVVLFSNHQTEPDPQAISLLLETSHPKLAQDMIFVAGHRVTTDPLTIPFSMGRNLLCIYSKKYIEFPPEKKLEKVHHNQKTMKKMRELLSEGGKCIYVAPSGGRDRPNSQGVVEVAPFDAQSIEMFWFTAKHSAKPTHFYPLALSTFDLLPPPHGITIKVGEPRQTKSTPIHLAFGEEIDMAHFPGSENPDKKQRRAARAEFIWNKVKELYANIC